MKALITGASSGLGHDFAIHLSNMGYELILVARRKDKLEELQSQLKTKSTIEVMDLSLENSYLKIFEKHQDIDLLINNAGYGKLGMLEEVNINEINNIIDLNIKTLTDFTYKYYTLFLKNNHGRIINIGSMAGYFPGPMFSTYYASKAYVNSFTNAIWYESKHIRKSKVRVVLISPGSIKTNFSSVASKKRSAVGRSSFIFTKKAIHRAIRTNYHTVIVGRDRFLFMLTKIFPITTLKAKIVINEQRKLLK